MTDSMTIGSDLDLLDSEGPKRIFINEVDSFHGKYLSEHFANQFINVEGVNNPKGMDKGGDLELQTSLTANISSTKQPLPSPIPRYQIVGTLKDPDAEVPSRILHIVDDTKDQKLLEALMMCEYVVYDIARDVSLIPKALNCLNLIEKQIERELKRTDIKLDEPTIATKVFILVSTIMTWAQTKPFDPDDLEVPIWEIDYKRRKPHQNFKDHYTCEQEVLQIGKKLKPVVSCHVLCAGMTYGMEEDDLLFLFKMAYNNEVLPVFMPGNNYIPLIHVLDLAEVVFKVTTSPLEKPSFILAVEQTPCTFRTMVRFLSKYLGKDRIRKVAVEEAFLYHEITQEIFDKITVNLMMEPSYIVDVLDVQWQSDLNIVENMSDIVKEFKTCRSFVPIKLFLYGPPAVGKHWLAKELCQIYDLQYVCLDTIFEEIISEAILDALESSIIEIDDGASDCSEIDDLKHPEPLWEESDIKEIRNHLARADGRLPESFVNKILKIYLTRSRCQNQGYVLIKYPRTADQAKGLFDFKTKEEREDGFPFNPKIIPTMVLTLEASDNFLYNRVMTFPESQIQGTKYSEENICQRLMKFRLNHIDQVTSYYYFVEQGVKRIKIILDDVADDPDGLSSVLQAVKQRLGPPIGFGLSPAEKAQMRNIREKSKEMEVEKEILYEKLRVKQAEEEYQRKMENLTHELYINQTEESQQIVNKYPELKSYITKEILTPLMNSLVDVYMKKPDDPVDALAFHLFVNNPNGKMFNSKFSRSGEQIINL